MNNQESSRDRLHIAKEDFIQARDFGRLLLDRESYDETQDRDCRLILQALDIAMIVAYCRPFTRSFDKRGRLEERLPPHLLDIFTAEESELHDQLLGRRNQEYAHSDASKRDLRYQPWSFGVMLFMRNSFAPWPMERVSQIVAMSEKLYLKLAEELGGLEQGGDSEDKPAH
jgi:hypothetical protein